MCPIFKSGERPIAYARSISPKQFKGEIFTKRKNEKHIRFSDDELAEVKKKAAAAGMTVGKYIRNISVFGEVKVYDLKPLVTFNYELNSIGRNINQIAARVNSTDSIYKDDINSMKCDLRDIREDAESYLANLKPQIL